MLITNKVANTGDQKQYVAGCHLDELTTVCC